MKNKLLDFKNILSKTKRKNVKFQFVIFKRQSQSINQFNFNFQYLMLYNSTKQHKVFEYQNQIFFKVQNFKNNLCQAVRNIFLSL